MCCRTARGPVTSSKLAASLEIFDAGHVEYDLIKHFAIFSLTFCAFVS